MTLQIGVHTVGPLQENCYLLHDLASGGAVLVDPGDEPQRLLVAIERAGARLEAIWLTHAHVDHIGGIAGIRRIWEVPIHLHPADRQLYDRAGTIAPMFGIAWDEPPPPDVALAEGDTVRLGVHQFAVWHLPGHAPGHVAFINETHFVGGDLLFAGSIGRTDLPGCDPAAMERSLARVLTLDDRLHVLPGHGPATTIGRERATNPFLG
ncbi:MAG: MBL fold metallo-hydrolase [Gemmatimonadaceae bacterium]|nr:MBL fold metallo-hydrolase [Gemmatimonadaceae bacterium]